MIQRTLMAGHPISWFVVLDRLHIIVDVRYYTSTWVLWFTISVCRDYHISRFKEGKCFAVRKFHRLTFRICSRIKGRIIFNCKECFSSQLYISVLNFWYYQFTTSENDSNMWICNPQILEFILFLELRFLYPNNVSAVVQLYKIYFFLYNKFRVEMLSLSLLEVLCNNYEIKHFLRVSRF